MATAMGTRTKLIANRSRKYLEEALYKRLFREGGSAESVKKELTHFLKSKKRVFKWEVGVSIKRLRERKRVRAALKLISKTMMENMIPSTLNTPQGKIITGHTSLAHEMIRGLNSNSGGTGTCLELSEKMSRRGMNLTNSDHAIRLDLVAKARGIASAEEYFINLPEDAKTHLAYGALLNCYCKELMTEKAEALMEKMKELRFASSPMSYNSLMTLYSKTGQPDKIPGIIQEMKVNDVMPDCFTYNIWMRSLAAMNDISGVERVMDEMKRDGRVAADWTTFSNLASIYVEAGMFQKAEGALKELERRNAPGQSSLEAYQFLITLYGRSGNLVEVYRIWRSLKLAYPKMANISYLNMIQVLVKLKDLPGAETCFKEWESKCSTYDVRIVNALLGAYLKEGMLEKAKTFKRQAKRKGARLNAKSWEIFMEYYLKNGDMKSVLRCVDRGIKKGRSFDRIWVPPEDVIFALMSYFEDKKDVQGAEGFIELLKAVKPDLGAELFESLIRTYVAAGKKSPGMRNRLKMENIAASDITERLLEEVCAQ